MNILYTNEQITRIQQILKANEGVIDFRGSAKDFATFRFHFGNRSLNFENRATTLDECYPRLAELYPEGWEFSYYGDDRSEISIQNLNARFDDSVPLTFIMPFTVSELALIFTLLEPLQKSIDMYNLDRLELRPGVIVTDDGISYDIPDYTPFELHTLVQTLVLFKGRLEYQGPAVGLRCLLNMPEFNWSELRDRDITTKMAQPWTFILSYETSSNPLLIVRNHEGKQQTYAIDSSLIHQLLINLEPLNRYAYLNNSLTVLELRKGLYTLTH